MKVPLSRRNLTFQAKDKPEGEPIPDWLLDMSDPDRAIEAARRQAEQAHGPKASRK